ncbi:MAG: tetratricopeptide repeat protein [Planctomycetaceae bacterium]|nr:tetratricopeptide repeat protein [Planctomycetaceae bacterium]
MRRVLLTVGLLLVSGATAFDCAAQPADTLPLAQSREGFALAFAGTATKVPAPLTLDDVPETLKPRQERTEADRDKVKALALFAAARTHEDRQEYADALRSYQRALRWDPTSTAAAEGAIFTAARLGRYGEAARYAVATKPPRLDPLVLARLVIHIAENGEPAKALALYEKWAGRSDRWAKPRGADILLRMEIGQLYFTQDKPKQAAECFAAVIHALEHPTEAGITDELKKVLVGEPGPTYQMMGDCFLAAGRIEEAQAAFQKAEELTPNKATRQLNLARVQAKTGKAAEALKTLDGLLEDKAANRDAMVYATLVEVLTKLGKKEELIGRLEKLRVANPKDLPLGYCLAQQCDAAKQTEKAQTLYLELLKVAPTTAGYRALANICLRQKRYDALLDVLGESVEKIGAAETLDGQLQTIAAQPDVAREVIAAARGRLKASAERLGYGGRMVAALLALDAKQFDTASEFFRLALATKPKHTDDVFLIWGVGLLTGDRSAEAAKVFQQAIDEKALPANNPAFHFYLAGALALDGRTDDALAAAQVAAEKRKDAPRFVARPAWVLYLGKRYDEAEKAYRQLLERFNADFGSSEARDVLREARLSLSNLAVIKGDLPQAEEWLEQVLDEFPDDTGAMNDLGYLWADQNKHLGRAERMIRQAVAAEPDNTAYRDSLGWLLFRQGKHSEALVELEKAAKDEKPGGAVLDHLGDTYMKLDRRDKAVAAWRKAAEAYRREKETDKATSVEKKGKMTNPE